MSSIPSVNSYTLPLAVKCTVTGLVKSYTSREYIDKCIARHGSLEKFLANYICRDAQRMLKDGFTPAEVRTALCQQGDRYKPEKKAPAPKAEPDITIGDVLIKPPVRSYPPGYFSSPMSGVIDWKQATSDTCFHPKHFYSGNCSSCNLFSVCTLPTKKVVKK